MKFQIRERNKTSVILLRSLGPNSTHSLLPRAGFVGLFSFWWYNHVPS